MEVSESDGRERKGEEGRGRKCKQLREGGS